MDFIQEVEQTLKKLGTIDDMSEYISDSNLLKKSYLLFEDKYEDSSDDSLDVNIYQDNRLEVTNESLSYQSELPEETSYLQELFSNSSFEVSVQDQRREPTYLTTVTVTAIAVDLEQMVSLIKEYRLLDAMYHAAYGVTTYVEEYQSDGSFVWAAKRVPMVNKNT